MASAVSHDDVGLAAVGRDVHAIVNAVNQQIEVDALRRQRLVRRDRGGGARGGIRVRRIVAQHAVLGLVAQIAVQRQRDVAVIAVAQRDHRAARCYRRAVHREVDQRVRSARD